MRAVRDRDGKIGGRKAAQRENGQRRLGGDRREALPAQRRRARMRRRREHGPEHREIEPELAGALDLGAGVAGRCAQEIVRTRRGGGQSAPTSGARRRNPRARAALDIAIQQHLRAARTGERDERVGERALPIDRASPFREAARASSLGRAPPCARARNAASPRSSAMLMPYTGGSSSARSTNVFAGSSGARRSCPAFARRMPARRGRRARRPSRARERNGAGHARADSGIAARATARRGAR